MIWFTSDWHFGHTNIAGPEVSNWNNGYRTFDSVEEHDDNIIDSINFHVDENDILYFLGDFMLDKRNSVDQSIEKIQAYRSRIECKNIHFVLGNHDTNMRRLYDEFVIGNDQYAGFRYVLNKMFKTVRSEWVTKINDQKIHLFHFPIAMWHCRHYGAWHLHGHNHGMYEGEGFILDVGIDEAYKRYGEYRPFSWHDIAYIMETKELGLTLKNNKQPE